MLKNHLLFIKKATNNGVDGGTIFDDRLFSVLRTFFTDSEVVEVPVSSSLFTIPVWKQVVDDETVLKIEMKRRATTFLVISHENLSDYAYFLSPDVFVIHNVFSSFSYPRNRPLTYVYKLGAKRTEQKVLRNSQRIICLSLREEKILLKANKADVRRVVPVGNTFFSDKFNSKELVIDGTYGWWPKRLNMITPKMRTAIKNLGYEIFSNYSADRAQITLITDEFVVGFKLKLSQAAQRGDVIISFADIGDELRCFKGYDLRDYYEVSRWSDVTDLLKSEFSRHTKQVALTSWRNEVHKLF